jgi:hypothetical protein
MHVFVLSPVVSQPVLGFYLLFNVIFPRLKYGRGWECSADPHRHSGAGACDLVHKWPTSFYISSLASSRTDSLLMAIRQAPGVIGSTQGCTQYVDWGWWEG